MNTGSPILLIEINKFEFIFVAVNELSDGNFRVIYKNFVPLEGINKKRFQIMKNFKLI